MSRTTLLDDAFAHDAWASVTLIDACSLLTPAQVDTLVPGTDRSILRTLRHQVGSHQFYLGLLGQDDILTIDEDRAQLAELRRAAQAYGEAWLRFVAQNPPAETMVRDVDEAGWKRDASIGLRLAQAIHHGTDHRSQICTALTLLGVEPPDLSVWAFGLETGRSTDVPPGE